MSTTATVDTPQTPPPAASQPTAPASPSAPTTPPSSGPVTPVDGDNDITITSTSDTLEQVQAALTGKPAEAKAPEAPKTPDASTPAAPAKPEDAKTPDASATPDAAAASEAGKTLASSRKSIRQMEQRIGDLTARNYQTSKAYNDAQAEIAKLQGEINALRGPATPDAAKPDPATLAKPIPKLSDFQNKDDIDDPYAAHAEAVARWAREEAVREANAVVARAAEADKARREQEDATAARIRQYEVHVQRTQAFRAETPDFDAVAAASLEALRGEDGSEPNMSPALVVAIERSPHGPALFYNLVQDPAEFHRINALPQGEMWIAIGEFQATLKQQGKIKAGKASPSTAAAATPSDPAARAVDALTSSSTSAAPVSKAPAPPTLVGGSPTASTVSPEEEDFRTFADRRNEAERTRRR